jgi:hypothetical protein
MNQDRFIELLNLYLDEEISAVDYSDLMLEVSGDSERQKIFEEYTRIYKACTRLGASFESRPVRRSFSQTIYAIGGLAAAVALLGMAGRNLMPFFGGQNDTIVMEQGERKDSGLFFPDIASFEVLTPRFTAVNEEPRIDHTASSSVSPIWSNASTFVSTRPSMGSNRSLHHLRDFLDARKLDLKDPFNGFSQFGEAFSIELQQATVGSSNTFGSGLALENAQDKK